MIAFDVEIKRCIPDISVVRSWNAFYKDGFGYEYCDSWTDYAGMGISVITTFNLSTRQPRIFLEDNFREFCEYADGGVLVGYNNHKFDDNLIEAQEVEGDYACRSIDLLSMIRAAAGEPPIYTPGLTRSSRRLGGLAGLNGIHLQGNGRIVDAPREWQRGNRGLVIDYCMRDTMMLVGLLDRVYSSGGLVDSATGKWVELPALFDAIAGKVGGTSTYDPLDYIRT